MTSHCGLRHHYLGENWGWVAIKLLPLHLHLDPQMKVLIKMKNNKE